MFLALPSGVDLLSLRTLVLSIGAYVLYKICLALYSVYLGPLSSIPGPKLAAATQWYETYYEIYYLGGGQFTKHIKEIHDKYGPIVRISPTEIHISDPEYYETIYAPSVPSDKFKAFENRLGMPGSTFSTADRHRHRIRRAAVAPFFTKSKVQAYAPFVQEVVDTLCRRMAIEYQGSGRPVPMSNVFAALTGDVVKHLAYGEDLSIAYAEDFDTPWVRGTKALAANVHILAQFPLVPWLLDMIPKQWLVNDPKMGEVVKFHLSLEERIQRLLDRKAGGDKLGGNTVFEVVLRSDLPPEEVTKTRLQHESVSIIAAGFETTRSTMCQIMYHVVANPDIYARLRKELMAAIPDGSKMPSWEELQKLPYLSAVVQEGLRIGVPVTVRSPRLFSHPLTYDKYTIPPNTPVSNDAYHMHNDPSLFPSPMTFDPDRWLSTSTTAKHTPKNLSRYMVAFGRGARMCLGMQIAQCELTLMTASLIRRFGKLELFETSREEVDFYADFIVPMPKPGGKGVRVLVGDE